MKERLSIRLRTSASDERGAYMILWALLLVGVMGMAAMLIDLGQLREQRRIDNSTADFAALAAGPKLSNITSSDPIGACQDAFSYVRINEKSLPAGASMPCSSLPSVCQNSGPTATTPVTITAANAAPFVVTIRYPVSNADIADPRLSGGAASDDGNPCERMQIGVARTNSGFFGAVLGARNLTTHSYATVRGFSYSQNTQTAALLLLDRTKCGILQTSGNASVIVRAADADHPGIIHADTDTTGGCTTNANPTGYAVYGTALSPSADRPGQPSIVAEAASATNPGKLDMYSVAVDPAKTHAAYLVPSGVSPAPNPGQLASRRPVDCRYNPILAECPVEGDRQEITALRTFAEAQLTLGSAPAGYKTFPTDYAGASCGMNTPLTVPDQFVFINCPGGTGLNAKSLVFNGTKFIIKGQVNVGSNNLLDFPNAQEILVSGSGTTGINVQGNFYVNEGALGASAQCANRTNANGTLPAHLVIDAGQFTSSTAANVRMCQTFVLLSKSAPYQQSIGSGSVSNTCTIAAPCPTSVNNGNFLSMFGNTIDWTAPNEFSVALMSYDDRHAHPYEDLAFWAETSNLSQIKGQGAVHTEGVFFLPNADMVLQGQATQLQALNAQFISKTLNISGQGTLNLKPNPADSVQILQASYSLIR